MAGRGRRWAVVCLIAVGLFAGALSSGLYAKGAGSIRQRAYRAVQPYELKALPAEPDWAKTGEPPLFTFVWMSDFHLDGSRLELTAQALRHVDLRLRPDFVMITGDNNAHAPTLAQGGREPPVTLRRQLFMKQFLADHLKTPYVIIPGDNWPQDFEKVFGAFQFSFDFGGMHFLFTSLDRCAYGVEGRAVFDEATWTWMENDLAANSRRPTLFMMHETILPPSFLDAVKTRTMLERHDNVVASFCGHLHVDVEFPAGGIQHLVCPSLGRSDRRGMKHVEVHRHALILRTVEYNESKKRFEKVMKFQKIDVPERLRGRLHKPRSARFVKRNYREIPPHPRRPAPELMKRSFELVGPLMGFFGKFLGRRP